MNINELKKEIEKQEEINISLFKTFEYNMHKEEMQPIVQEWREGSKKLRELLNQLYELEKEERKSSLNTITKEAKTFVNSFGEATTREITSMSYKRAENKRQKQIMSFIGTR